MLSSVSLLAVTEGRKKKKGGNEETDGRKDCVRTAEG